MKMDHVDHLVIYWNLTCLLIEHVQLDLASLIHVPVTKDLFNIIQRAA